MVCLIQKCPLRNSIQTNQINGMISKIITKTELIQRLIGDNRLNMSSSCNQNPTPLNTAEIVEIKMSFRTTPLLWSNSKQ